MKRYVIWTIAAFLALLLVLPGVAAADQGQEIGAPRWTVDQVLDGDTIPFAIGHRGYGANLGEDPDRPIENTVKAVRRAFRDGVMIVEVDTVLTADGVAAALHDDYLPDLTCVNTLTFEEVREALGDQVASLRQILQTARTYSIVKNADRPSGQVIVEIKMVSPFCVPLELEPAANQALVDAVLADIRFTRMAEQVAIESYSPEILAMVQEGAEEIPRMLALDLLQLLSPDWIEENTPYKVQQLDKNAFGIAWGEVGVVIDEFGTVFWMFRRPSYYMGPYDDPFMNYIHTLWATYADTASVEKDVLFMAGDPSGPVALLHYFGFDVLVHTIADMLEWSIVAGAGADGIFVDDIPMGLTMEMVGP